jgi:hypothetical protein
MSAFFVSRNRQQLGQFSEEEVATGLQSGRFLPDDLGWKEGMESWQPLSTFGFEARPPAEPAPAVPADSSAPSHEQQLARLKQLTGTEDAEGLPWEIPSSDKAVTRWWETTKAALLSPISAFRKMRVTGGLKAPFIYLLIGTALSCVISVLVQILINALAPMLAGSGATAEMGITGLLCAIPIGLVVVVLASALGALITAFVGGGLMHVCLMLFGGAARGFEATYRAVCYASGAVNALQVVPILGSIVALVWGPVVYVIALKEAQKTDYWRAICAFLLPTILCCSVIFLVAFTAAASLASYFKQ